MGRPSSTKNKSNSSSTTEPKEVIERKRLKKLAFRNNLLSETETIESQSLLPSKTVLKHHGKDILRKSQRKNRYLFSFPGLLAPLSSGGTIGQLKDLGTKNPILYLHFPQGQLKLFGTIVYPKNRYLTLHFSRGGKNVMCEDYFDSMIVFSEAWWIGTEEENPHEARLDFPKQFLQDQQVECDFKGGAGAGAVTVNKQALQKSGSKFVREESPETELDNDLSDDENDLKDLKPAATPVRHSARTAGKTFKFADDSSEDDSVESIAADTAMKEEDEDEGKKKAKSITSSTVVLDFDNDAAEEIPPLLETKTEKLSDSVILATSNKESNSNRGSLVQATISTLFNKAHGKKKVEEKSEPRNSRKSLSSKVSDQKLQHDDLKRKIDQAAEPRKKGKKTEGKKAGTGIKEKKEVYEIRVPVALLKAQRPYNMDMVEDDDIEEFSSSTQDTEESDEDWAA